MNALSNGFSTAAAGAISLETQVCFQAAIQVLQEVMILKNIANIANSQRRCASLRCSE